MAASDLLMASLREKRLLLIFPRTKRVIAASLMNFEPFEGRCCLAALRFGCSSKA